MYVLPGSECIVDRSDETQAQQWLEHFDNEFGCHKTGGCCDEVDLNWCWK